MNITDLLRQVRRHDFCRRLYCDGQEFIPSTNHNITESPVARTTKEQRVDGELWKEGVSGLREEESGAERVERIEEERNVREQERWRDTVQYIMKRGKGRCRRVGEE